MQLTTYKTIATQYFKKTTHKISQSYKFAVRQKKILTVIPVVVVVVVVLPQVEQWSTASKSFVQQCLAEEHPSLGELNQSLFPCLMPDSVKVAPNLVGRNH